MRNNDDELWGKDVVEALPLIMERFNISEREAYKMWFEHQPKNQPRQDVVNMDTDEKRREARERLKKSSVAKFSFKTGKQITNDSDE
jgi:hypothetical protein